MPVALALTLAAQAPDRLVVDPSGTSVTLHVGRAGLFAFAGHEHEISAPVRRGDITLDQSAVSRSAVFLELDAGALAVTGEGEPAEDVPEVQRVMLSERVLDVQRFPTITFRSREVSLVEASDEGLTIRIAGDLTLHGVTRALEVPVDVRLTADGLRASGRATVRQKDFGIEPVTAGAGTVRVKDEVDVVFSVTARRP
jgi:polyisoprenoid-binding protein YceI